MNIRKAEDEDGRMIIQWLTTKQDCEFVTGKTLFSLENYQSWFDSQDQVGFMLLEKNKPVAYGEIWVDEEEQDLELAHLVVDPCFRNKGVGKKLVQFLLQECASYSYPTIYMRVTPENDRALSCYLGVGFVEDESMRPLFNSKWIWLKKRNG
ncbi:GNAT family N-acetyltransferase [Bacillus sp. 2205SS5-2]|uniref:GNAT family N-acetyltransferase n=1 Tax=Bacillus sp. 2205SS5-2 TaxID=3109031 RepID=UPI003007D630